MDKLVQILEEKRATSRDIQGINVSLEDAGIGVRIRRAGGWNTAYTARLAENTAPYRLALRAEALTDETADHILARTYGQAVVMRWWVLPGRDDVELPLCTADNIERWLMNHPDAFAMLVEVAETEEYFVGDGEPGRIHPTD